MMRLEEIHFICVYRYRQKSIKVYKCLFSCMCGGDQERERKRKNVRMYVCEVLLLV